MANITSKCYSILEYVKNPDQNKDFQRILFDKKPASPGENIKYTNEENIIWDLICNLTKIRDESLTGQIEKYVFDVLQLQLLQVLDPDRQEPSQTFNSNQESYQSIDKDLLQLKKDNPNGIDTSDERFINIIKMYKEFFIKRCEEIVAKKKKDQTLFKDDPELREFMIRHNRFVPLFNLRYISADLLEQMAIRFSRMKSDPGEIEKEYDKIELS